jgi:hypothetical protein
VLAAAELLSRIKMTAPIKVTKVCNGTATVKTRGLRRVVIHPGGRVVRELCEIRYAKAFAESFNASGHGSWAEIQKYPQ